MTLHFVVTLKLKTVMNKGDRQLRRSRAGSYPASNVAPTPLEFKCELQLRQKRTAPGFQLRLQHPVKYLLT